MNKNRFKTIFVYAQAVWPLAVSQLLQRLEPVVDNRFIGRLGIQTLLIHSIQYNFFLVGQAIGLAAATSALIYWKRAECADTQKSLLWLHVLAAGAAAFFAALILCPFVSGIARHFHVDSQWLAAAKSYLTLGLALMAAQAIYAPINAMLIATGQEIQSMLSVGFILMCKWMLDWAAITFIPDPRLSLHAIMIGSIAIMVFFSCVAVRQVLAKARGVRKTGFGQIRHVFFSELGTAGVRSTSPILFGFLIAAIKNSANFYVSFQLVAQLAYIICLPVSAGTRISLRDASQEESHTPGFLGAPMIRMRWFWDFISVALIPTAVLVAVAALAPHMVLLKVYGYVLPASHARFVSLYYLACYLGQIGNMLAIPLRASKQSRIVAFNFLASELGAEVGLMSGLVYFGLATATAVGWVVVIYCGVYTGLNCLALRRFSTKSLHGSPAIS